jgi:hypothetical protein
VVHANSLFKDASAVRFGQDRAAAGGEMSVAYPPEATGAKLGASLTDRSHVNMGTIRVPPSPHPVQGRDG